MNTYRPTWLITFALAIVFTASAFKTPAAFATSLVFQTSDERTMNRYLLLLEKRPVAGTAFDRVFKFYDQQGRLDQLIEKLKQPAKSDQATISRQLLLGMVYVKSQDAALAIQQLQLAKQQRPSDPTIDDQIAQAWMLQSEFSKAADAWQSAFARTKNRSASLQIVKRLTSVYGRLRQSEKSLDVLLKFEKQFPGDSGIQDLLTTALIDCGQTDAAVLRINKQLSAASRAEERLKLKNQLADLMLKAGRTEEAIAAYEDLLDQLNPSSWQAQQLDQTLQQLLARQPDQTRLLSFLTERVRADPSALSKRLALMKFFQDNGRHTESLQVAAAASAVQQQSADLIRSRMIDQLALKHYQQVEASFRQLEANGQLAANDVIRWGQVVSVTPLLSPDERQAAAVQRWNKLLTLPDDDVPQWQRAAELANQLARAGMVEAAIQRYSEAVQNNKPTAKVFVDFAKLLFQRGEVLKAKGVLQKLVSLSSKSRSNIKSAIDVLRSFDQLDTAVEFGAELVEQDGTSENRILFAELLLSKSDFALADQQIELLIQSTAAAGQSTARQQIVDLLLKTGFVSAKVRQLKSASDLSVFKQLLLAQLAEVQGELTLALQTLQKVPDDSAVRIPAQEMLARIQQKAGQLQDAEQTLKSLISLVPKRSAEYQEWIQNLQLQMGRNQDAYQTAQALFQASPQSASSVSRYVAFLKNSDRRQEATSVLIDFLSQQQSSASMMVELGDLLAEQFRSDEAMKWFWKALDQSTSEVLQRDIATRLVVLALRTNQTDLVLQRLKSTISQSRSASASHRTLLMVDAYRQARQLSDAVVELQNFLTVDRNNVAALTELVDLLSKQGRTVEASQYQFRLAGLKPTTDVLQLLTELLDSETDVGAFEGQLGRLAKVKGWPDIALKLADSWFAADRISDAELVVNSLRESDLPKWKLESRDNYSVLALQGAKAAQAAAMKTIRQSVNASELLSLAIGDSAKDLYAASTMAEAQAIAGQLAVSFDKAQQDSSPSLLEMWQQKKVELSSADANPIALAKYTVFLCRGNQLDTSEVFDCAKRLAALNTVDADVAALSTLLAVGQKNFKASKHVQPWNSRSGELVLQLLSKLQVSSSDVISLKVIEVSHALFVDSGLTTQAKVVRRSIIPATFTSNAEQLAEYWSIAGANQDLDLANDVLKQWVNLAEEGAGVPFASTVEDTIRLPDHFGRSLALFCSLGTVQQRADLLETFLVLKGSVANSVRRSASSAVRRSFEVRWTEKTSHRVFENGRHVGSRNVVTLPEVTPIEMTDVTFFVNLLHGLDQNDRKRLAEFSIQLANQQSDDSVNDVYRLTSAYLLCLESRFDDAMLQLIAAADTNREKGSLRVLIAAYHAENGHSLAALNLLKTISRSDVVAYRQSLWLRLSIGGSSGQLAVADQAASALLGTRLSQDERRYLQLVTKSRQLAVKVPQRSVTSPKTARPMETLITQMQQKSLAGEIDQAIEIANSILLTTDETQHSTSMTTAARQSAVKLLAQHGQLKTALIDVDRRLVQNPRSSDLLSLKLQILTGMNRTADAEVVQQQLAVLVPESPQEWVKLAKDYEDDRRFVEAVDTYLKAFQAKPSLLLVDYYRYFKVFRRVDRLPDIADLLLASDLRQLRDNYFVVSELIDILLSQSDSTDVGRRSIESGFKLLSAAWKAFPSDRTYLLNNIQAKRLWESKVVVDFVCDSMIPNSAQQAFARPWLGLDSKPVEVEGVGRLSGLQRVLMYLNNDQARSRFLNQVIEGQKQFPEWLAGPYIEAALLLKGTNRDAVKRRMFALIDLAVDQSNDGSRLPTVMAAKNAAGILRGVDAEIDGRLAVLVDAVMSGNAARSALRGSVSKKFVGSTHQLLAELQFSSGRIAAGRRTVLQAIRMLPRDAEQSLDAEAAWNRIQDVLSAVELLRSADLTLDAVNVSKQVRPGLLSASRNFQSNDSLDRACQRMWQQADRSVQSADRNDVERYLDFQIQSVQDGLSKHWDLQLNSPAYGDRISWQNSDLISMIRRISKANPADAEAIKAKLFSDKSDQLSAAVCLLAMQSPTDNLDEYLSSVRQFVEKFSGAEASDPPVGKNGVLAWCSISSFKKELVSEFTKRNTGGPLIQQVLEFSLGAIAEEPVGKVWRHCILVEAAEVLSRSQQVSQAADAWTNALNTVVPSLAKQPLSDRSPLKETRRLLLGP